MALEFGVFSGSTVGFGGVWDLGFQSEVTVQFKTVCDLLQAETPHCDRAARESSRPVAVLVEHFTGYLLWGWKANSMGWSWGLQGLEHEVYRI